MNLERILKILCLCLAVFDLLLGTILLFWGGQLLSALNLPDYAEPRFFMMCVGVFLYQYVYIQFMAYKNPSKYATCLNMIVVTRLAFPVVYISAIFLWGAPYTVLHQSLAIAAVGDLAASFFILYAMKKLGISFFQGDEVSAGYKKGSALLKKILLVLVIGEFFMSWNWILIPHFWLQAFAIEYTVDPFWTRATGLLLLIISYIQYLGYLDMFKYRTAVTTSGLYRALWPLVYWYWIVFGEANLLFKGSIMFFSIFNIVACITILRLQKKKMEQV